MFDWDEIEKQATAGRSKDYAPNGEYTTKIASIKMQDNENWKSPCFDITWQDNDQYQFPKSIRHWLPLGNENFRRFHARAVLMELGIPKDKAQQAIETAEKDTSRAALVKGYQQVFDRAVKQAPAVKIVVRDQLRDGKPVKSDRGTTYGESDFANHPAGLGQDQPKIKTIEPVGDIDPAAIPF